MPGLVSRISEPERERRSWWVLDQSDMPVSAEGLRCTPASPDAWWFPSLGFSTHESNLFTSRILAVAQARINLAKEAADVAQRLDRLNSIEANT